MKDITDSYPEYEKNGGSQSIKVAGRLKNHTKFWQSLSPPAEILRVVEHGYVLPFTSEPTEMFSKNNASAVKHVPFVSETIQELCLLGTVEKTKIRPKVISPLTVSVQNNGKKRLILDLRLLNKYVDKVSVKYEDMRTALMLLKTGVNVFKFDLKSEFEKMMVSSHPVTLLLC